MDEETKQKLSNNNPTTESFLVFTIRFPLMKFLVFPSRFRGTLCFFTCFYGLRSDAFQGPVTVKLPALPEDTCPEKYEPNWARKKWMRDLNRFLSSTIQARSSTAG